MADKFKQHRKAFGGRDEDWELINEAMEVLGFEDQSLKAVEEASEFSAAMIQFRLGKKTREDVITEIADTLIMLRQMAVHFGIVEVEAEVQRKMAKVQSKVDRARRH